MVISQEKVEIDPLARGQLQLIAAANVADGRHDLLISVPGFRIDMAVYLALAAAILPVRRSLARHMLVLKRRAGAFSRARIGSARRRGQSEQHCARKKDAKDHGHSPNENPQAHTIDAPRRFAKFSCPSLFAAVFLPRSPEKPFPRPENSVQPPALRYGGARRANRRDGTHAA